MMQLRVAVGAIVRVSVPQPDCAVIHRGVAEWPETDGDTPAPVSENAG
jgi:hypothetical protein